MLSGFDERHQPDRAALFCSGLRDEQGPTSHDARDLSVLRGSYYLPSRLTIGSREVSSCLLIEEAIGRHSETVIRNG